jgi:hypothetical protein
VLGSMLCDALIGFHAFTGIQVANLLTIRKIELIRIRIDRIEIIENIRISD